MSHRSRAPFRRPPSRALMVFLAASFSCTSALFPESNVLLNLNRNLTETSQILNEVHSLDSLIFRPALDRNEILAPGRWLLSSGSSEPLEENSEPSMNQAAWKSYGADLLEFVKLDLQGEERFAQETDLHHIASFYYNAAARFLLRCENRRFAESVGLGTVNALKDGLRRGVVWFSQETSWNNRFWQGDMHHRLLQNASVIYMAQNVLGNLPEDTLAQANRWIQIAIDRQKPDGTITELGGPDTGLQALAITFGTAILKTRAVPEPIQRRLELLVKKGADWLAGMVSVDGKIDDSANTCTFVVSKPNLSTGESPHGILPIEYAFSLQRAAFYFNDPQYHETAELILIAYHP